MFKKRKIPIGLMRISNFLFFLKQKYGTMSNYLALILTFTLLEMYHKIDNLLCFSDEYHNRNKNRALSYLDDSF